MRDDKQLPQGSARRSTAPLGWVALRGPSGRLYGYLDPATMIVELKRKGEAMERIDLKGLMLR
jgi:hypothetical protein